MKKTDFFKGIKDGLPICVGYLSVAFAFGIFSTESGLTIVESLLISMVSVTSAGQFAGVPVIASGGSLIELAATQFVINSRYALMSVSLSQRLGKSIRMTDRLLISFVNTDEIFAVAMGRGEALERGYMYGLILTPYIGWSAGTLAGAIAGNILPHIITSALGIAIYGMFTAIVVPEVKKHRPSAFCVLLAIALSCAFACIPQLKNIPDGFVIIICAAAASLVFAFAAPVKVEDRVE